MPLVNLASFNQKVPHVNPVDGRIEHESYGLCARRTQTQTGKGLMGDRIIRSSKRVRLLDLIFTEETSTRNPSRRLFVLAADGGRSNLTRPRAAMVMRRSAWTMSSFNASKVQPCRERLPSRGLLKTWESRR